MRRGWLPNLCALAGSVGLLSAALFAAALASTGGGPSRSAAESKAEAAPELLVKVRPSRVYCALAYVLSVEADPPLSPADVIRWETSCGTLLFDDLREVQWRAPREPGSSTVKVSVTTGGRTRSRELSVEVRKPSTEGMVWIPPGTFLCGDVAGTKDTREIKTPQNANDEPFHDVFLDGYWIDRRPVTHGQYARFLEEALTEGLVRMEAAAVMGELDMEWVPYYYFQPYDRILVDFYETRNARKPYFLHAISWDGKKLGVASGHEDTPVVDVTWFGSLAYAHWHGKQLPTDAQWEKAARGADGRRYPWGNNLPTPYHTPLTLGMELYPVGHFSPEGDSPHGLSDTLSGLFEWTNDWFNPEYYEDFFTHGPHGDPLGTFWGRSHCIRGFPNARLFRVTHVERPEPVTNRYEWIFDFMLGDTFGNRQTTFRCGHSPGGEITNR